MTSFSKSSQKPSFTHLLLLLIYLYFLCFLFIRITQFPVACHACHEHEGRALLDFKLSLHDPSNRLSSWNDGNKHDCCNRYGIECSTNLFHVVAINLRNTQGANYYIKFNDEYSFEAYNPPNTSLSGELSSSISNITHLEYLDLSFNDFQESQIPFQLSNLTKLSHLDLSRSNLHRTSTKWVTELINLQVLKLSGIDLSEATSSSLENFDEHISHLSNLRDLDLSFCRISNTFPNFHNLSRLSSLNMEYNELSSQIPLQLANLTSLSVLDLTSCGLQGSVPYLPQLKVLDLSDNRELHPDLNKMFQHQWPKLQTFSISFAKVVGSIPVSISNAPMLVSLEASNCGITGFFPSSIYNLSRLRSLDFESNKINGYIHPSISNLKSLNILNLFQNNFQGSIPNSICEVLSLQQLILDFNNITGTIPTCLTKLKNLTVLSVSRNSIGGNVPLISLINELNLTDLDLSSNKLKVDVDQQFHLYSKFKLVRLGLGSCNLKGDVLIPSFVCELVDLEDLNLFHNHLTGAVPSCLFKLKNLNTLILSNNKFSGSIPFSICSKGSGPIFRHIDFSNNQLSGMIPTSTRYCMGLQSLNLGTNNLTGNVPIELENVKSLEYLILNDNNLDGTPLNFISKLQRLAILNLANNSFEGSIPSSFGSFTNLLVLSLRSNKFKGSIPEKIFELYQLQILDLSQNNLSGRIPKIFGRYWMGLDSNPDPFIDNYDVQLQMVINGIMLQYENLYNYTSGIDLSSNMLDGNIPAEIGFLKRLARFNLSRNHFSENIPSSLGNMSGLVSLDLSFNRLSGPIPQSLTSLSFLGVLNLSYNNLTGRIPSGGHFDTLIVDSWILNGNDLLCGSPTNKLCPGDQVIVTNNSNHTNNVQEDDHQEDANETILFYGVIALGAGVGFWGLFLVLFLRREKWWFPYWRFVNSVAVKIIGN